MERDRTTTKLPAGYKLLAGERPLSCVIHPPRVFTEQPSSLEQMMRLTRSPSADELGIYHPSVAALAFDVSARTSVAEGESPLSGSIEANHFPTPEHLRLYEVLFGRDSLRVAIDLISSYPELARTTILRLAEQQGTQTVMYSEEEWGKILHEYREADDVKAQELTAERGWLFPYYGSVDATPEFIRTLAAYCRQTEENNAFLSADYLDRSGNERTVAYAMDAAVDWILSKLDSNPEGLLEFKAGFPTSIENQVWKDSWDAYHHADGTMANHNQGIASIEVQVTTYDALLDAAELYDNVLDDSARASELSRRAAKLKQAIIEHFWTEDKGGYFVLGTDRDDSGQLRQMKIRTSNMGHVLNSRLLEDGSDKSNSMRDAVVRQILSPELLSDNGIRTLASDELRYRPGAYHNGSVWLWDTHHIAKGLRRQGYKEAADDLDRRLLHNIDVLKMFPEYIRGDNGEPRVNTETITIYDEIAGRENKLEQPPQEVQAWTVAVILAIKKRIGRLARSADNQALSKAA